MFTAKSASVSCAPRKSSEGHCPQLTNSYRRHAELAPSDPRLEVLRRRTTHPDLTGLVDLRLDFDLFRAIRMASVSVLGTDRFSRKCLS